MALQMPPQAIDQLGAISNPLHQLGSASMQMEEHMDHEAPHLQLPSSQLEMHPQPDDLGPNEQPQIPPQYVQGQTAEAHVDAGPSTSAQMAGQSQAELANNEYLLQELQTLASRVDGVVQEVSQVKQVQAALEALIRGSTTAAGLRPLKVPVSPKKKPVQRKEKKTPAKEAENRQDLPRQILPVENVDSDSMYDWPPIKTVEECWKEMYEGLEGRPSLMSLEERYGSAWRRKKGQRQRFCEKKQVCDYIKHLASENRCTHQLAIQHLANKKESLCKLLLRLRQFKKSAREIGRGNGLQSGAQQGMQPEMHQGLPAGGQSEIPSGMPSHVQSGGQQGLQPEMQAGGQTGMQITMQPVMQGGGQSGLQNGMQIAMQPVMQGGVQSGLQNGMQIAMRPVMQAGGQNGMQVAMQPVMQSGVQLRGQGGMQSEMQQGMQTVRQLGGQSGTQGQSEMHAAMQTGMQPVMHSSMQTGGQSGMHPEMQTGMQEGLQVVVQPGVQGGMQTGMPPLMEPGVPEVQDGRQNGMGNGMRSDMEAGMQTGLEAGMQSGGQPGMQGEMQGGLHSELHTEIESGLQVESAHE